MSLEKKVMLAAGLLAAGGCAGEERSVNLGDVVVSEAVTDADGKAYFSEEVVAKGQTGEEVEITITAFENPVSDATVLYFDNLFSEGFLVSHPAFAPQLNIALHNSGHQYSLTPASLQILHKGNEKEQSKEGAKSFFSWAKDWENSGWEHTGCLNRENMVTLMKPGVYLMKIMGIIKTIGFSERDLDQAVDYIDKNLPASAVAEVYVFIPSKHGFLATTTITAMDVKFSGGCIPDKPNNTGSYDNSNNTYNNTNDDDDDCGNLLFCDYFRGTALNSNKWNDLSDSGVKVYGGWLSLSNASSIASRKGLGSSCSDNNVELRGIMAGGALSLGNDIALYATNDAAQLVCGNNKVGIDAYMDTENKIEVEKSNGNLYLRINGSTKAALPCSSSPSSIQLTAGFNDTVEVDYVEVKCK